MTHFLRKMAAAWIILGSVSVGFAQQQMPPIPTDPNVRIGKLDNGLTYYIRHKGSEVTVIDSVHIRLQLSIFEVTFAMHLQKNLQSQLMSHSHQIPAFFLGKTGCNQQYC